MKHTRTKETREERGQEKSEAMLFLCRCVLLLLLFLVFSLSPLLLLRCVAKSGEMLSSPSIRAREESDGQSELSLALEERLSQFEVFIIQKVRQEMATAARACSTRVADCSVSSSEGAHRETVVAHPESLCSPRKLWITMEAVKGKHTALEHRQAALEAKVNALVSDFVFASQTNKREMDGFAAELARARNRHRDAAVLSSATISDKATSLAVVAEDKVGPVVEAVMQEQREAGLRMREFVGVVSLIQQEMEKDRHALQESQAQSYALMERVIERVNLMDEDIATLMDRQAASEGLLNALQHLANSQDKRLTQLEHAVNLLQQREETKAARSESLVSLVESATMHQKNHESAVSQKLLAVSARIEQLTNSNADLLNTLGALRCDQLADQHRHMLTLRDARVARALQLASKNCALLRACYFRGWQAWQQGRSQARRNQLVLKLFLKQKQQLDLVHQKLEPFLPKARVHM